MAASEPNCQNGLRGEREREGMEEAFDMIFGTALA